MITPLVRLLISLVCVAGFAEAGYAPTRTSSTFTLMTYNIHVGVPMGESIGTYIVKESDLQRIGDIISSATADVVALQEVDCEYGLTIPSRRRTSALNEPRLLSHFTGLSYIFGSAQDDIKYPSDNPDYVEWGQPDEWTNNRGTHGEVGNAVLTRHPFRIAPENISLTRAPDKERRACLRIELSDQMTSLPQEKIVIYATHLQHDSGESRMEQMKDILNQCANETGDPLIFIMGDLNSIAADDPATSSTEEYDIVALALKEGFHDLHEEYSRAHGRVPEPTFPAHKPNRRIDYILCNRNVKVINARTISTQASDHLPLVVTVAFD